MYKEGDKIIYRNSKGEYIDTIEKTDDKYFPKNESYEKQKTLIQCIKILNCYM